MIETEWAGHWTGPLEWLPTDRFAKSDPDWTAPEMLGRDAAQFLFRIGHGARVFLALEYFACCPEKERC